MAKKFVPPVVGLVATTVYGIFDQLLGEPVLDYDTFVHVKLEAKMKVSDFAVENGAFASYNKVNTPYSAHIQLAVTDTAARRQAFLARLSTLRTGIQRVNIVTQDRTYLNATLAEYSVDRTRERGWGKIVADLHFIEVREVFPQYTNARPPGGRGARNGGQVDPAVNPVFLPVSQEQVNKTYEHLGAESLRPGATGTKVVNSTGTPTPPKTTTNPATAPTAPAVQSQPGGA